MRILAAVVMVFLVTPDQTLAQSSAATDMCLPTDQAAGRCGRSSAGNSGSTGSGSSGTGGAGSSGNYDPKVALLRSLDALADSMEQSRLESVARREAEAEQQAWEEQQYARSFSAGNCPEPGRGLGTSVEDFQHSANLHSKWAGWDLRNGDREGYANNMRVAQEYNCLVEKAKLRDAQIERERSQQIASFNQYLNPPEHLRIPLSYSGERSSSKFLDAPELMTSDCLSYGRYDFKNNCDKPVVVAWAAAKGPCKADALGTLPCTAQLAPGEYLYNTDVPIENTRYVFCLSPGIIWDLPKSNDFGCVRPNLAANVATPSKISQTKFALGQEQSAGTGDNRTQAQLSQLEPEIRSHIGNKAFLASEGSLSRLRERSAISDYGFDKALLANQCIESYYETYPNGAKASRFKNSCNRKIVISWFDSDGWCKERLGADWSCSTDIGPNKVIGTTMQPEGTRREYGACFDPGLPVRRGSEYGCAAWSKMGGSDYVPGDAMEWVDRLSGSN